MHSVHCELWLHPTLKLSRQNMTSQPESPLFLWLTCHCLKRQPYACPTVCVLLLTRPLPCRFFVGFLHSYRVLQNPVGGGGKVRRRVKPQRVGFRPECRYRTDYQVRSPTVSRLSPVPLSGSGRHFDMEMAQKRKKQIRYKLRGDQSPRGEQLHRLGLRETIRCRKMRESGHCKNYSTLTPNT